MDQRLVVPELVNLAGLLIDMTCWDTGAYVHKLVGRRSLSCCAWDMGYGGYGGSLNSRTALRDAYSCSLFGGFIK